ncbi:hypothetical protein KJ657_02610 [Patescibacteria group bacterium]|nr:hypothetical protein [Patescibacteria group bacterium]MBU1015959.1 hypothetical protein [Patescibacteria group bacterium]MBU1685307.1 hypothetical protein [Patescibacteria group bacterium]MBU1939094.1 hypothetical protein [Patescibacteria group bacterium]
MKRVLLLLPILVLSACQPILKQVTPPVTNFEECIAAGNPVMESYPRQCRHGDQTFTEEIDVTPPVPTIPTDEGPDLKGNCESAEGTWLPDSSECEYISKDKCEELGGTFNECASACRNDPEAEICTMQCVQVCQF